MPAVEKHTHRAVAQILRHNARTNETTGNPDIDRERSHLNYKLSPGRRLQRKQAQGKTLKLMRQTDYEYYRERKAELYCYNRADVKSMASWLVTLPKPKDYPAGDHEVFFKEVYSYLAGKYGEKNVVSANVHMDEKTPHMHFDFIPVVPDGKRGGEKICANDLLNRKQLKAFHPELQKYLKNKGIDANVNSGITKAQGGNRKVKQMKYEKELTERERTIQEKERELEQRERELERKDRQKERKKDYERGVFL